MENVKELKFKHTVGGLKLPKYENDGTSLFNIYSAEEVLVSPMEIKKVRTGIGFDVPEGYALLVLPKQNVVNATTLRFANAVTVVESGNTDELVLDIENSIPKPIKPMLTVNYFLASTGEEIVNDFNYGYVPVNSVLIKKNDCIAQGILIKTERIKLSRASKKDGE